MAIRIQALRNLPFIVVSNPNISKIYGNYLRSLSTLLPYQQRHIATIQEEEEFVQVLADLVESHTNTIPILARGFLECRKYINPADVTRFLDEHLRVRIGTRLIAQQHLALHFASDPSAIGNIPSNYIGVIDTKLQPARVIRSCEEFVGEICELKYGVRPRLVINGESEAMFAHVPVHLEYIITELLKNAFRSTVESGNEREPIEVTIAIAPDSPAKAQEEESLASKPSDATGAGMDFRIAKDTSKFGSSKLAPLNSPPRCVTIRIRDRGGGIPPTILPHIWSYSFTTFSDEQASGTFSMSGDTQPSSIAGLGYGLPLSKAYAEYFDGDIAVQSLWGWGTDVYLTLRGLGQMR